MKNLHLIRRKKSFGENKTAYEYLERMQDHLKENGLKLSETDYIVGRTLNFDSETETVIGDSEANQLLNGSYRAPYTVSEKI